MFRFSVPTAPAAPAALVVASALCALHAVSPAAAQRLPLQCYGARDGLPNVHITALLADSHGFLWVGTADGLARFDGTRFANFSTLDGLGHPLISDFIEEPGGRLWIATDGGVSLARRNLSGTGRDRRFETTRVRAVASDPGVNQVSGIARVGDEIWAATSGGILRGRVDASGLPGLTLVEVRAQGEAPREAITAWQGRVVYGGDGELVVRSGDAIRRVPLPGADRDTAVVQILPDRDALLVLTDHQLFRVELPASGGARFETLPLHIEATNQAYVVLRRRDRSLWIGTRLGVVRLDGAIATRFDTRNGLPTAQIRTLAEDREGGLWLGTLAAGLCRLSGDAIGNYGPAEGLDATHVEGLLEARDGAVYAGALHGRIYRIAGDRAVPVAGAERPDLIGAGRRLFQDARGDFWIGSDEGVFFAAGPRLDLRRAVRVGGKSGLPADWPPDSRSNFIVDPEGRLWSAFIAHPPHRSDLAHRTFAPVASLPGGETGVRGLAVVRPDLVWFTTYWKFGRLRHGAVEEMDSIAGEPLSRPVSLFQDSRGSIWIGFRHSGVAEVEDPDASAPRYRRWSTANGLSSNAVWEIAEDRAGHLLFATEGGLNVLDRATGIVRRLTAADGLAGDLVATVLVDHAGRIWVGTGSGLSRLDRLPAARSERPRPVVLTGLEVGGEPRPFPASGLAASLDVDLEWEASSLAIEFTSPNVERRKLRYQYRLRHDEDHWSVPSADTALRFARLAAGRYALAVRAIDEAGQPGPPSPDVRVRVTPPFWHERWFQLAALAAVALVALAAQRLRLGRALAVEGLRRHIAADLHDDIGSGLSDIAILSEVARRGTDSGGTAEKLSQIADTARELRSAMADIVWSVDPRRDRLSDLLRRLRETAYRLEGDGIEVVFEGPGDLEAARINIAPDRKRNLLLLFKEALHNVTRHAHARHVRIDLRLAAGRLHLRIADDGVGFDPHTSHSGLGLASMTRRAQDLGGALTIESRPAAGTSLGLAIPLRARRA